MALGVRCGRLTPPLFAPGSGHTAIFPMIVTCSQMNHIEAAAFARGVSAAGLMEEAGRGIASVVRQFFPKPGLLVLYLGKGNNAGDALVAGRELQRHGWRLMARLTCEPEQMKPLPAGHWLNLGSQVERCAEVPGFHGPVVLLDGLLGIGATGPLAGPMRALAAEMNSLRRTRHACTVAMDIPSGLNGDTGEPCADAVMADITVTVDQVKTGLLADAAIDHVGRLALVPLLELASGEDGRAPSKVSNSAPLPAGTREPGTGNTWAAREIITSSLLLPLLPRRPFGMHKGQAGRVAIIAGSRGYLGAAVLSCLGALRGGAGLITLFAKADAYDLLAMKLPPEIMVRQVTDYAQALTGHDVVAIGPGLGFAHESEVLTLLRQAAQPLVVDADALTILAKHDLGGMAGPRLLTPHPGEMARLVATHPGWSGLDRVTLAEAFAQEHPGTTLLLKGSRSLIATADLPSRYNITGHPGMATGGIGDVLTGLSAALIAQGMSPHDAASLGSWLVGRAAEVCLSNGSRSPEALSAGDLAESLGSAFNELREGCW